MAQHATTISIYQCHLLALCPSAISLLNFDRFMDFANALRIPIEICSENFIDATVLESLVDTFGALEPTLPRKIIVLCGAFLEEQISLAAQHMLVTGYPVLLLRDLIVAKNPEHSHIHDARLLQAGTVATTWRQLVYEWAATEEDQARREMLNELLEDAPALKRDRAVVNRAPHNSAEGDIELGLGPAGFHPWRVPKNHT